MPFGKKHYTFLFYAGQIRAKYEFTKYEPTEWGGDSPITYWNFLTSNVRTIFQDDPLLRPQEYSRFVTRIAGWNPHESTNFDPGWKYARVEVSDDLAIRLRDKFLQQAQIISMLLNIPEFFDAFRVLREHNNPQETNLQETQQSDTDTIKRVRNAIDTMRRIEKEKGVDDYFHLDAAEKKLGS